MSKTVTFVKDVYPYCVGDVVVLNDEEAKAVDAVAKSRKVTVYVSGAKQTVESSAEADRQAANREASEVDTKAVEAARDLEVESAEKDAAEGHAARSGRVAPGTSGSTELKTAAAAGKHKN